MPLLDWDSEDLVSGAAEARVAYGYDASLLVLDSIAAETGSTELIAYLNRVVRASADSGEPISSADLLAGIEHELGFTDSEEAFSAFVFGSDDRMAFARDSGTPPPLHDVPRTGLGIVELVLLLAAVAGIVAIVAVVRSLHSAPLGGATGPVDGTEEDWHEPWDQDEYAMAGTPDSEWSF